MNLLYKGKTKDVYENNSSQIILKFKDDATGEAGVFDPGANTVGLQIPGSGKSALRVTTYYFEKIKKETDIPTHFISANLNEALMTVTNAEMFGNGLEVICRYRAVGSFLRRYAAYCEEGEPLNALIEITIKDDEREDPPISRDAIIELGLLNKTDYETIKEMTKQISNLVKDDLFSKGLELYDIKLEFGRDKQTGKIILIDEISGGNMRVYKNGVIVEPIDLADILSPE